MFSTGNDSSTFVSEDCESTTLNPTLQMDNDELRLENEYLKERLNNAIKAYRNLKSDYDSLVKRYNLQAKALCQAQQKYADLMNDAPFDNGFLEYCK